MVDDEGIQHIVSATENNSPKVVIQNNEYILANLIFGLWVIDPQDNSPIHHQANP
jgi:hypothetical protein